MPDALCDTGPLLHLHEISDLAALEVFETLLLPRQVVQELDAFELPLKVLFPEEGSQPSIELPPKVDWKPIHQSSPELSPADAEVLATGRKQGFRHPILTDDLTLRRRIEQEGGLAVGSLGILLRNHRVGRYDLDELKNMVQRLMDASTLHLSPGFRAYVRSLIQSLP